MKKLEKYIYLVIVIVLVGVIASRTTYIIMKDNNTNDNNINDNNNNNENEGKKQDSSNKEEKITLNDEELGVYLSFVPNSYDGKSAYEYEKITVNNINQQYLLNMALGNTLITRDKNSKYCSLYKNLCNQNFYTEKETTNKEISTVFYNGDINETDKLYYYFMPEEKLKPILHIMYNREYNEFNLKASVTDNVATSNGTCYIYFDGGFSYRDCVGTTSIIYNIENYEINGNDLIIYTETGELGDLDLVDLYTKKSVDTETIKLNNDINNYEEYCLKAEEYLKKHKDEFTKYKHTFKKNDTGYYWYSTEVV